MLTPLDHALVACITILLPVHDLLFWYPRLRHARPETVALARRRAYREAMAIEWGLCAATLLVWQSHHRAWNDLGLGTDTGWGFWLGAALGLGILVAGTWQRLSLTRARNTDVRTEVLSQLENIRPLLPQTPEQLKQFGLVAVTAGICEEVLFRGFVIWYLDQLVPTIAAFILGAILFGMAHAYQGTKGVLQTGLVGLGLVVLYAVSGSLWVPIVVHAFVDLNSGLLAYTFLSREPNGNASSD